MSITDFRPPRALIIQGWLRSLAVLLFAFVACLSSATGLMALKTAHDANDRADENVAVNACRAQLAAEDASAQGAVNTFGWSALLEFSAGDPPPERAEEAVAELGRLIDAQKEAAERRLNAAEICADGEP